MEWVETTGKTVEEAKDHALDQLGVDEQDAEFEVLEEPRTGLFGRVRGEARVRARVRPTQPRPKVDRRERRGRGGAKAGKGDGGRGRGQRGGGRGDTPAATPRQAVPDETAPAEDDTVPPTPAPAAGARAGGEDRAKSRRGGRGRSGQPREDRDDDEETIEMTETELVAQGEVVRGFLLDLLDAFGLEGSVTAQPVEDDGAVELDVTGADLGLLIGPKGQTLQAVQELARSVLQRQHPGEAHAKVRIDVSGYRQRRREALERFVRQVAADVVQSGAQKALEPMSPPDRKVVHDTVNDIEGVHTVSEGEDLRRRVVIIPDA